MNEKLLQVCRQSMGRGLNSLSRFCCFCLGPFSEKANTKEHFSSSTDLFCRTRGQRWILMICWSNSLASLLASLQRLLVSPPPLFSSILLPAIVSLDARQAVLLLPHNIQPLPGSCLCSWVGASWLDERDSDGKGEQRRSRCLCSIKRVMSRAGCSLAAHSGDPLQVRFYRPSRQTPGYGSVLHH